jgi:hypothetical protein
MAAARVTRRKALQTAALAAGGALATPFTRCAFAAGGITPTGAMTLAWHTNIAPRWLDPGQHDGSATPDNFLMVVHDALIKNYKTQLYDHLALADRFEFAEDARSATFRLRENTSSMTDRRSRPTMSNGATSTITGPGPRCSTMRPTR